MRGWPIGWNVAAASVNNTDHVVKSFTPTVMSSVSHSLLLSFLLDYSLTILLHSEVKVGAFHPGSGLTQADLLKPNTIYHQICQLAL